MVTCIGPTAPVSGDKGWLTTDAPFWGGDRYTRRFGDLRSALSSADGVVVEREGVGYVPMLRAVAEGIETGLTEHPLHPMRDSVDILGILDRIRAAGATRIR
jgi:hypothetical protein